jgi:DNA (cytosine-5)-methyltransferase 3A
LFDGKSGGLQALKESGIQVNKYYASEIKEDGIKVALDNHSEIIQIGDVTKVKFLNGILYTENNEYNVGKIDLLIGGSPCQDFSQANIRRDGLNGTKSGLFFEWLRLRDEINPTYWLLENVRMKPEHLKLVNNFVGTEPVMINSKLVSAQNRERYYWTNINNGEISQPKDMKITYRANGT